MDWNGPTARYPVQRFVQLTRGEKADAVKATEIDYDCYAVIDWFEPLDPNVDYVWHNVYGWVRQ